MESPCRITDLGTLDGPHSTATRINANGSVTGEVANASGGYNAARWDRHGRGTDLGTLPGGTGSNAVAIADDESVAGYADTAPDANPSGFTHTVRWARHGRITDLDAPEPAGMANDVNSDGTAVGEADDGATGHAVRWGKRGSDRRPCPVRPPVRGRLLPLDRTVTSYPVATNCGTR